jgi:hypothetical protein
MNETFTSMVEPLDPGVRSLAVKTRELIYSVMPGVVEVPWPRQRIIGYGVGPKKMTEHFCYISLHKNHIDLGFNYGSELPDPEGLLEGTGALFRHVKIKQTADVEKPALLTLLEKASKHRMPEKPSGNPGRAG